MNLEKENQAHRYKENRMVVVEVQGRWVGEMGDLVLVLVKVN